MVMKECVYLLNQGENSDNKVKKVATMAEATGLYLPEFQRCIAIDDFISQSFLL